MMLRGCCALYAYQCSIMQPLVLVELIRALYATPLICLDQSVTCMNSNTQSHYFS